VSVRLLVLLASLVSLQTVAQGWPDKAVRFIVPFPPGSAADAVARIVGQSLGGQLGQQLVIDNRVGASGNVGALAVARAAPDGYTLGLATASTHAVAVSLSANLPYDPLKDFAPVSMIGSSPYVVVVYPGLPVKNVAELVAFAKTKPRALNYASVGPASLANLSVELFSSSTGALFTHVPYRSSAQALLDLIEGRIQLQFGTLGPSIPHIRDGKVRALGVTAAKRVSSLPNVPTLIEAGVEGYEASLWMAVVAPAGTGGGIVNRLNRELTTVLQREDVRASLVAQGLEPDPGAPEELRARIRADIQKWREVIAKAGIRVE
jgi:tripartite-type tricarboxylate transporter receptor subunit TctC